MPFPHVPSPPTLFPIYLLPSLPFRRRKSSTDSNSSTTSNATSSTTTTASEASDSPLTESSLHGYGSHLRCARCASDLALSSQIISKGFTGRHGRAYLVAPSASSLSPHLIALGTAQAKNDPLPNLPNTYTHKPVPRQLVTGAHTVGDISCAQCGSVLGWKYVAADEESQKYKIGKFILETKKVCRSSMWEGEEGEGRMALPPKELGRLAEEHREIEFDSQDEDECEDLFLGVWTPQLAARRRKQKRWTPE